VLVHILCLTAFAGLAMRAPVIEDMDRAQDVREHSRDQF
jgi:hypothetical protein